MIIRKNEMSHNNVFIMLCCRKQEMEENMKQNVKQIGKTVVSGMLVVSLVMGNGAYVQAEKVTKEESVYVNAAADGTITKITVSDWLKNAGINGVINDRSTLQDIQNVKGEETFEQSSDGVKWNTGSDDIYYQGTTDQELPVGVKITYQLDGKEVSAEEIAGKSGKVTITVSYTNESKVNRKINGKTEELYTPFLMVTGLILPTDKFSNVEVDGGKIINEGSNNIVVGYGVPGMAESLDAGDDLSEKLRDSFEITADVENFSLSNTITYAGADIFSELELEDNDTLEDLEEDLETLVDSSEELVDGSQKISEKMGELADKFDEYAQGEEELNDGIHTLADSSKKLKKGVKKYTAGVNTIAKGTSSYVKGAKKITNGNISLYNAVKDMPDLYKEFSDGIKAYTAGVDALADTDTAAKLQGGAQSVSGGISTLNQSLAQLKETYANYSTLVAGMKQQAAAMEDEMQKQTLLAYAESLQNLADQQKAAIDKLIAATGAESELKQGADQVAGGISKMTEGASEIAKNSESLRGADTKFSASIDTLVSSIEKLKNGSAKLSSNNKKLLAGSKKVIKAGKTMNEGSSTLITGVDKLKKGSNKISNATGKVSDGIAKLKDGAGELYDGMYRFDDEGIQEINDMYETDFSELKERLETLLDIAKEYDNFSGIAKGMDGKVKFVIETQEIKSADEE